ncbi:MAG: hypothetical protein CMI52_02445 [Parcubacteria group bacterium]|nr:hypothetical protein [Parcubacteria group bacterium]|tara:strand:- start:321 stop:722 length:402 start_codon:yes stop_codon:yes gene_type:complete
MEVHGLFLQGRIKDRIRIDFSIPFLPGINVPWSFPLKLGPDPDVPDELMDFDFPDRLVHVAGCIRTDFEYEELETILHSLFSYSDEDMTIPCHLNGRIVLTTPNSDCNDDILEGAEYRFVCTSLLLQVVAPHS